MVSTRGKRVLYQENPTTSDEEHVAEPTTKRRATKKRKTVDGDFSNNASSSKPKEKVKANTNAESSTPSQPVRKPGRRLQGRLADLMNMPIDIFADICLHLHPLDLLHLAWAAKPLRGILMSKDAKAIWRTARENQVPDLPDCPDCLTEPQYAALVFTTVCQGCGTIRAFRLYYSLYARYCATCLRDYLTVVGTGAGSDLQRQVGYSTFLDVVPHFYGPEIGGSRRYSYTWARTETIDKLSAEWVALQTPEERTAFIDSHKAIVRAMRLHTTALDSWQREEDRKKSLLARDVRQGRNESIKDKLVSLGWDVKDLPANPSKYDKGDRREWFKLTEKTQALTEKVWDNLYPKLLPLLTNFNAERLEKERLQRISSRTKNLIQYYRTLRDEQAKKFVDVLFPGYLWNMEDLVSKIPLLKELIENDDGENDSVPKERWEETIPKVIEFLKTFTDAAEKELAAWYTASVKMSHDHETPGSLMHEVLREQLDDNDGINLRRSTVVFACRDCNEPLWYPACLQHDHCRNIWSWNTTNEFGWTAGDRGPLHLKFKPSLIKTIAQLLVCMGVDRNAITSLDLPTPLPNLLSSDHDAKAKYICLLCDENCANVMSMPKLIEHFREETACYDERSRLIVNNGRTAFADLDETQDMPILRNDHDLSANRDPTMLWKLVSDSDANAYTARLEAYRNRLQKYRYSNDFKHYNPIISKYWREEYRRICKLCPKSSQYDTNMFGDMVVHVKAKHGIDVESELECKLVELEEAKSAPAADANS
ncbi:hypothetical protein FRC02_011686 [Tulasnella sp. 418]|nr:hypothetical protein FRC02_011686 [Tulasnella sp. 418]